MTAEIHTVDPQPILPPITCACWCRHQDGHPGERWAVDQRCETEQARVYLDLADRHNRNAHEYVGVYVEREGAAATPHVYLHFDDNIGVELTPQEARRLARPPSADGGAGKASADVIPATT